MESGLGGGSGVLSAGMASGILLPSPPPPPSGFGGDVGASGLDLESLLNLLQSQDS
jgi:hypothetical protein